MAHRNLGMVAVKMGDYATATEHLEEAMVRYADNFDANFYLAEAYRGLEKYAEAIFRYQTALRISEDEPKALKALSWSYYKIRYYSEALATAKKLQQVAPKDEQGAIIVARTFLKLGRAEDALAALRAARSATTAVSKPFFNSVEGDVLSAMGRLKEAEVIYRAALKEEPLLAGALLGLGRCLHEQGEIKQAIMVMERAARVRPSHAEIFYSLGKVYEEVDRRKALRHYEQFRKLAATDPEFIAQIGEVRKRMSLLKK